MKRIYSKESLCLGCKLCEVFCKTAHSQSGDPIKAWRHELPAPRTRIHVEGDAYRSSAVSRHHCSEPRCVQACISGAMTKDPQTGIVSCNAHKCIGCMTCILACPFGAIAIDSVALKCDLCTNEQPACVFACPNQALVIYESEE